jgi:SAM-dependent methyltransferase
MPDQAELWSRAARNYEEDFIDPYRPEVRNPLLASLKELAGQERVAADLGCGIGPLLPFLAGHFKTVYAIDFAAGMLTRARERCGELKNIEFLKRNLNDLAPLHGQVDVAVAVNSFVMADLDVLEGSLTEARAILKPGGRFIGIVPAIDAVHYVTMLLVDRARKTGMPREAARHNAAHHGEHKYYDFAFGEFRYQGLEQHFWQPFEVDYRLQRAGFGRVRLAKVLLDWTQFPCGSDFKSLSPPWDWFFEAETSAV